MLVDTSTRLSKRVGGTFVPRISSAPFFWGVIEDIIIFFFV
jgi:hypothetical protein